MVFTSRRGACSVRGRASNAVISSKFFFVPAKKRACSRRGDAARVMAVPSIARRCKRNPRPNPYDSLISVSADPNRALTAFASTSVTHPTHGGEGCVRSDLPGRWSRRAPDLRRLRRASEAGLTMLMILLYAAGGLAIAVYMIAALLRPEKF
jgi:hypothetical protein